MVSLVSLLPTGHLEVFLSTNAWMYLSSSGPAEGQFEVLEINDNPRSWQKVVNDLSFLGERYISNADFQTINISFQNSSDFRCWPWRLCRWVPMMSEVGYTKTSIW